MRMLGVDGGLVQLVAGLWKDGYGKLINDVYSIMLMRGISSMHVCVFV